MAFAGIFQPFARLRWIRFGLLMRDRKIVVPLFRSANNGLSALFLRQPDDYFPRVFGLSDNTAQRGEHVDSEGFATACDRSKVSQFSRPFPM
jgi:hypothetical protein